MELLGNYNFTNNFKYDSNGFLIVESFIDIIFFDKTINKTKEDFQSTLSVSLKNKTNNTYTFDITVTETYSYQNVAKGTVEIQYDKNNITSVLVNGVQNGSLEDKYSDCFNIYPHRYLHILYKNYKYVDAKTTL
jgi:hypothetical protein